jgi:hypothetical protein
VEVGLADEVTGLVEGGKRDGGVGRGRSGGIRFPEGAFATKGHKEVAWLGARYVLVPGRCAIPNRDADAAGAEGCGRRLSARGAEPAGDRIAPGLAGKHVLEGDDAEGPVLPGFTMLECERVDGVESGGEVIEGGAIRAPAPWEGACAGERPVGAGAIEPAEPAQGFRVRGDFARPTGTVSRCFDRVAVAAGTQG